MAFSAETLTKCRFLIQSDQDGEELIFPVRLHEESIDSMFDDRSGALEPRGCDHASKSHVLEDLERISVVIVGRFSQETYPRMTFAKNGINLVLRQISTKMNSVPGL